MSHAKIHSRHLERSAYVYLRQSSPTQIRNNREGQERQLRMQDRVRQLGWPASQIRLLDGDSGFSGTSLQGRNDYLTLVQAVRDRTVGIIAARELSRLARDNQDWNQLVRWCRFYDILLCDEQHVYDAHDSQDRVLLGIQGAFSEFEWSMITDRMQECLRQKAARGEQYDRLPPGYICRQGTLCEKHPDERVQRAVQAVFEEFERFSSVHALFQWLCDANFQLPVVPHGADWRDVTWRTAGYHQLLGMLRNPAYAGIYVRGRHQTMTTLDEQGQVIKRTRPVPREDWSVVLENHHEPYITPQVWEANMQKISLNAPSRAAVQAGAPRRGESLLCGLLRCRRCGHKLRVSYSKSLRYACQGGTRQRDARRSGCFSFTGRRVERVVEQLVLDVVRPAGLQAALLAAERMATEYEHHRQVLVDRLEHYQDAEARAEREYKATDESYTSVRRKLAEEWDAALDAVAGEERRLSRFDASHPQTPTQDQIEQLQQMAAELRSIWQDEATDAVLKKQIVRTLIEEISVDMDESRDELMLCIHWQGGHHNQLQISRGSRGRQRAGKSLATLMTTLRKILADDSIAAVLNRENIAEPQGASWTKDRVAAFRRRQKLPAFSAREKAREGWLTQAEAATSLGLSAMSVSRLVQSGVIPAERPVEGLPCVIRAEDLLIPIVQRAAEAVKASPNRPLPADPNQLSLF